MEDEFNKNAEERREWLIGVEELGGFSGTGVVAAMFLMVKDAAYLFNSSLAISLRPLLNDLQNLGLASGRDALKAAEPVLAYWGVKVSYGANAEGIEVYLEAEEDTCSAAADLVMELAPAFLDEGQVEVSASMSPKELNALSGLLLGAGLSASGGKIRLYDRERLERCYNELEENEVEVFPVSTH